MKKRVDDPLIAEWTDDNEKFFGTFERAKRFVSHVLYSVREHGWQKGRLKNGMTMDISYLQLNVTSMFPVRASTGLILAPAVAEELREVIAAERYRAIDSLYEETPVR